MNFLPYYGKKNGWALSPEHYSFSILRIGQLFQEIYQDRIFDEISREMTQLH